MDGGAIIASPLDSANGRGEGVVRKREEIDGVNFH